MRLFIADFVEDCDNENAVGVKNISNQMIELIKNNEEIILDFEGILDFSLSFFIELFEGIIKDFGPEATKNMFIENMAEEGQNLFIKGIKILTMLFEKIIVNDIVME